MSSETELMSWLRDAHAMEKQAIQILQGEARRIESYPELRTRIAAHLDETQGQAEMLERCIERHGSTSSTVKDTAAAFIGNMQALSGLFVGDEVVKGAIASYTFEHLEIASYRSLIGCRRGAGRRRDSSRLQRNPAPGGGDGGLAQAAPAGDHPAIPAAAAERRACQALSWLATLNSGPARLRRPIEQGKIMQLKEIMTRNPVVAPPEATLREAARTMRELDSGVLPVGDENRVLGVLTDRDITIRATAEGKDPNSTPVREVMSAEVISCFEDEDDRAAAAKMAQHQLRRMVVLDRSEHLVGIVSLGDLAVHTADDRIPGEVTEAVSEPSQSVG